MSRIYWWKTGAACGWRCCFRSMAEMAHAGEDHRQVETVGGGDDFFIADRATGVNEGCDSVFGCLFHAIRKRKERVRANDCASQRQDGFCRPDPDGVHAAHLTGADAHG